MKRCLRNGNAKKKIYKTIAKKDIGLSESEAQYNIKTYVSLFSSAGVGCYGFKEMGYLCIATVELLEKRLKIQKYNKKCIYDSGYICGDMTDEVTQCKVVEQFEMWKSLYPITDVDVVIATPPCQGMSVANHKKGNELKRNSLVVESIKMTKVLKPRFFIFENVRGFMKSICTDLDGIDKPIGKVIDLNLSGEYNILTKVINFKDYGCPSSRTRTLVIGVRKDQMEVTPYDLFPDQRPERTLRETIGHLPSLKRMGEIWDEDIYHNYRKFDVRMLPWIENIKEGQSAFDNEESWRIPHTIKNGVVVYNTQKNGDKYTRQYWDRPGPCIHTRNDILASQNTIHPKDNRVFSIRELMLLMSVPDSFKWSEKSTEELNLMLPKDKEAFLRKEEMNIRQNLGEAVPTVIFQQIAKKILRLNGRFFLSDQGIDTLIQKRQLSNHNKLIEYISSHLDLGFPKLSKIAELANSVRDDNAAYYTRQDICYAIVKNLPDPSKYSNLRILEPSIGVGNFLPMLIEKYRDVQKVTIDVVDIDPNSLATLQALMGALKVPDNIKINLIEGDFLLRHFDSHYDIVIGNPPYKKITKEKKLLLEYKRDKRNIATNNIFSFFIEKSLKLGDIVSLIVPKSLINAPEFNETRNLLNECAIATLLDFGEKAFKGVKIETISFVVSPIKKKSDTRIESYITNTVTYQSQSYITDSKFPYWLIYRNEDFDDIAKSLDLGIFKSYRDRSITQSTTKQTGLIRVLKSRNIISNGIQDIPGYDCFMDDVESLDVAKFLNAPNCVLVPNLTYKPRACFLPKGCIVDGSVAVLTPKDENMVITPADLTFFGTPEFSNFYMIARNRGSRSLNIDNNSVFFFGKRKCI